MLVEQFWFLTMKVVFPSTISVRSSLSFLTMRKSDGVPGSSSWIRQLWAVPQSSGYSANQVIFLETLCLNTHT